MLSIKTTSVFYDREGYPFKDSSRATRFPIAGGVFAGTNNTKEIRFYVDQIGGTSGVSWVVVSKLPDGKIGYEVCSDVETDSELGEQYLSFDLSAYYTQVKGDLYLSLRGYQGEITFTDSNSDGVYEINGDPLIEVTGTIKLAINYSPMVNTGTQVLPTDVDRLIAALSNYLLITSGIIVIRNIANQNASNYNVNQILLEYTISGEGTFYVVHRGAGNTKVFHKMEFADLRTDQLRVSEYILLTNEARLYYDDNKLKMTVNGHTLALDTSGNLTIDNVNVLTNVITIIAESGTLSANQLEKVKSDRVILKRGNDYYYKVLEQTNQIRFRCLFTLANIGGYVRQSSDKYVRIDKTTGDYSCHTNSDNYYTKDGVDYLVSTLKANTFQVVDSLPETGEEGIIYLVETSSGVYQQYIWESNAYVDLGTTQIDLSNYATLNTNQTISGLKTFSTLPQSSVVPSNNNDLTPKSYVDTKLPMVEYSEDLTIGSLPNAGWFVSQGYGYYQFYKVKQGTKYDLTVIEPTAYYIVNNLNENDTMSTFWGSAVPHEVAYVTQANEFIYAQNICGYGSDYHPLDLSSGPSANVDNGTYIAFYTRNFGTNIGSIGVKNRKPAFKNNYGVNDYLVLESEFNELKAMFYETTVDVQDYNLTYATYSALPTSLSSQPIIFSAGTDVVELKGRSYVVNNYYDYSSWIKSDITMSKDGNVITCQLTANSGYGLQIIHEKVKNGDKVLTMLNFKGANGITYSFNAMLPTTVGDGNWKFLTQITTIDAINSGYFVLTTNETSDFQQFQIKDDMAFVNLTQWFGSNDAIPADLLTTPSLFLTKYWKGDLSYNTGHIEDSKPNKLISYGFNIWDEEWELGSLNFSNGQNDTSNDNFRSKNYIKVIPNATYFALTTMQRYCFYDKDKNYIGNLIANNSYTTFTIPANACYMRFYDNGTTYNHDICINISNASLNGTYKPYIAPSETPITSNVLRSAGSVQDTNEKVNVGVVDLGTLDWTYVSGDNRWYAYFYDTPNPSASSIVFNGLSQNYVVMSISQQNDASQPICIAKYSDRLFCRNGSSTTAPSGILYFELNTPTDQNPAITLPENIAIQKGGSVEIQYASGYETPCDITFEMATSKIVEE